MPLVLDGWWDEMYDGRNGWAIPSFEHEPDLGRRDQLEADALFALLEGTVVPLFYTRDESGIPADWLDRVRASLSNLGPKVTAGRMLQEYVQRLYEPASVDVAG